MDHGPNIVEEDDFASEYKSKVGIRLFFVYSILYAGFIAINTFIPHTMATKLVFGLNVAVLYGFGLILTAVVLGLVYNHLCTRKEDAMRAEHQATQEATQP